MVKDKTMLDTIFTNDDSYDQLDTFSFVYYDCTLVRSIGDYPAGCKLSQIAIDYDSGTMSFFDCNGDELASFDLELTVKL